MTNTSENKPVKAKGPIRTGMLVPSLILFGLIYAYFFFFFDTHLRHGIEFAATRIHGAEVNVGSVSTSFLRASFRMQDLEVTNKEQPEMNLFQVGDIRFGMLWDALLRGKVAINDAAVLDIRAMTKRKKPGYVIPPPPPTPGNGVLAKVQDQVLQQTQKQFNNNFLGDIADVVGGVDPKAQLASIQGDLKAQARAKELQAELEKKKAEWQKRIADLPKPKEIQELEGQIKALDLNPRNPAAFAANLKKAKEIVSQAEAKVKQVEQTQSQLTGDIQNYTKAVADLQKLAEQDVADLQKRLQIPSIDPKEFSTQLFLGQVEKKLVSLRKYIEVARKYMPPKKTKEQKEAEKAEALVPRKRGEGVTYAFPITTGYPLFWLKKAAVSSEISQSEWAGKVSGEILDLTTSPSQLGRPTKIHLAGDFPKQNIHGFDFLAVMDHTTDRAKESVKVAVGSFPILNQVLSDSPKARLAVTEAQAAGKLEATLADQALSVAIESTFNNPKFDLAVQPKAAQEIMQEVLKGIPTITMNASVTGSWDKFDLHINSNLGSALSSGFQKQLQAKLGEAKAKLQSFVSDKLGGDKKKAEEQLAGLAGGPGKMLAQNKEDMLKSLKSAQSSATGGAAGGGGAGKFLKGFGF